jgi:hypothetical protein
VSGSRWQPPSSRPPGAGYPPQFGNPIFPGLGERSPVEAEDGAWAHDWDNRHHRALMVLGAPAPLHGRGASRPPRRRVTASTSQTPTVPGFVGIRVDVATAINPGRRQRRPSGVEDDGRRLDARPGSRVVPAAVPGDALPRGRISGYPDQDGNRDPSPSILGNANATRPGVGTGRVRGKRATAIGAGLGKEARGSERRDPPTGGGCGGTESAFGCRAAARLAGAGAGAGDAGYRCRAPCAIMSATSEIDARAVGWAIHPHVQCSAETVCSFFSYRRRASSRRREGFRRNGPHHPVPRLRPGLHVHGG